MGQELIIASRVDIFKNLYLIGEVISEGREKKDLTTSVKGRCFTCFFFLFFSLPRWSFNTKYSVIM